MYDGCWPALDWRGLPYDRDSQQGKKAGKPLARGYRAVLLQLCGDLDYFSKWIDLPVSTNRTRPCAQCRASYHGNLSWLDNRENSGWQLALLTVSTWTSHWRSNCDLFQLPGMSCWSIAYDLMHNLYLGWLQHFYGSVFYLLTHECLTDTPLHNLSVIEDFIKSAQSRDRTRQRYRQRLSKLSMFVKKGYPKLKGRASDIRGLDLSLWKCWKHFMNVESLQHQSIEMFLRLNVEVGTLLNEHGPRQGHFGMPSPFAEQTVEKGCQMAQLHVMLMEHFAASELQLFNCTSKLHFVLHTLKLAKHCHPYLTWCFKNESNMRVVQQLWKSCLSGNKHYAVGNVAALKHRHLQAIRCKR